MATQHRDLSGGRVATRAALALLLILLGAAPAAHAQSGPSAPFGTSAVVLVGGFNSSSPFSTPACATTDRGPTWGEATGPAAALSGAGLAVFTMPIANAGVPVAASCLGGQSTPDIPSDGSTVIDSNGALADNQAALVAFLGFLQTSYGITTVSLVGHSDGGLWSRAAISALRAGSSPVTVTSLTTIGTPHTGSFGADIAVDLQADGGSCSDLSGVERVVCTAIYAGIETTIDELGQTVIEELSSSWLSQWNPTTTIGCPVTTLGGNHVGWDLGVGTYYTANDGIVGQASALNQGTWLPFVDAAPFTPVGPPNGAPQLYDVVHSESLSFLSANTELNTPAVAAAVAAAVQTPPSGPCAAASSSALRGGSADAATATPRAQAGAAAASAPAGSAGRSGARASSAPAETSVEAGAASAARTGALAAAKPRGSWVALRSREATRNGTLSAARRGDAILLLPGATVRCGARTLPAAPLLGSSKVRVATARCSRPLRVHGRALRLARSAATLHVTRSGRTVRWSVAGARLRHVRAQLRVDGRWRTVATRRVTVPRGAARPALRVTGVDRAGRTVRAFTRVG